MFNSKLSRAVLGVLVLACAPAMGTIPPAAGAYTIKLRFGGMEQIGPDHYRVAAGSVVTVEARAGLGDFILVMATTIGASGDPDKANASPLLAAPAPLGTLSGAFKVPQAFAGKSFMVGAVNWSKLGGWGLLQTVKIDVYASGPVQAPSVPLEK